MKEYTIKVTEEEIKTIGNALGKQTFNDVVGLVLKLQTQVNEQNKSSDGK